MNNKIIMIYPNMICTNNGFIQNKMNYNDILKKLSSKYNCKIIEYDIIEYSFNNLIKTEKYINNTVSTQYYETTPHNFTSIDDMLYITYNNYEISELNFPKLECYDYQKNINICELHIDDMKIIVETCNNSTKLYFIVNKNSNFNSVIKRILNSKN